MTKRVVLIENQGILRVRHRQLVIEPCDAEKSSIPLEDMGVLILDNPAIMLTQAALVGCVESNVSIVICNKQHNPITTVVPSQANARHRKILGEQIASSEATKNRLWKEIVRAKIEGQGSVLTIAGKSGTRLVLLKREVKNGDPENREAQASRYYWRHLYGPDFRRNHKGKGINILLNYGYALIRASVARAIVSAGLNPSLGIHHSNQYNAFGLADDLMEPFRPVVDLKVFRLTVKGSVPKLNHEIKGELCKILTEQFLVDKAEFSFFPALQRYVASVYRYLTRKDKCLMMPHPVSLAGSGQCG